MIACRESHLLIKNRNALRDGEPGLLLANPQMGGGVQYAGIRQVGGLQLDGFRYGRVEMVDPVTAHRAEFSRIDVAIVGTAAPIRHHTFKLDRVCVDECGNAKRTRGQLLALFAVAGHYSEWRLE